APPGSTLFPYTTLFRSPQQPAVPAAAKPWLAPQPSAEPRIEHPIEAAAAPVAPPLPALAESDPSLQDALAALFGSTIFDQFFYRSEEHTSELQSLAYLV